MASLLLKCDCGTLQGTALNASPKTGNRVVCCCRDCQAFAAALGKDRQTLDKCGGTEIYQTSMSHVKIHAGHEALKSLRLTPKGMLRWYASCCNTPVANSMTASIPFIGILHTFIDVKDRAAILGNVRAYCQTQDAIIAVDHAKAHPKFPLGLTLRIMRQLLVWKLQGKNKPSAFFTHSGAPVSEPRIINQ